MAVSTPIISYSNYSLLDFLTQTQPLQGQQGKQGPRGRDGKRGKPGKKGDSGGLPGANGKTILYGPSDPLPNQGVHNDSYINTTTYTFFGPKGLDGWPSGISIIGSPGERGEDGRTIYSGSGSPSNTIGSDGDFYFDMVNQIFYGPKGVPTPGIWESGFNVKGDQGDPGNTILYGDIADMNNSMGKNGDLFLDTTTYILYGPKDNDHWDTTGFSLQGMQGEQGLSIRSGPTNPDPGDYVDGEFFINTTDMTFWGPKTSSGWGNPILLKGDRGDPGISLLNGTDDPDDIDDGLDGDFWLNTTTYELFGPKTAGSWPNGVSIMGIQGPAGTSILNDMIPPLVSVGNTGDFYIDTSTNTIYGPKPISGPWPAGVSIKGDQGDDGNTILYGTIDPPNSLGNDGDTYINTATMTIYFDKTAGAWPLTGVNIVGPRGQALLNGTVDPDDNNDGMNGDFYLNTITYDLFGPKTGGAWPPSVNIIGLPGNDGTTIRYGSIDPINSTGNLGDFYYNTSTNTFFGPKPSSGTWPEGVKLDGNTILNGSGTPSNGLGNDGDYYIDTVANTIAGPKNSGVWPTGRLLGSIFLTGTVDPTTEGVDGDYYFNSVTRILYGPKDTGVWPSNGTFLGTVLSSGTVNPTTEGVNGDYYINISTRNLFGPKTEGTWPTASAILGSIFLSGTNDPSSGTGQQGDYYINTTSRQLFGPKTNTTTWPAFSAILGNQILSGATTPPPSATGVQGDYYFCTSTGFMWGPKTSATVWPGTGTSLNGTNGTNGVTDYRYHFSYLGNTQITNRGLYIQGCVQDTATLSTPTNGMTSTTAYGYMLEKTSSLMEVHIRIRGACSNTSSPSTTADIRLNMRLHRWTATSTVTTAFFVDIPQSAFGYGAGSGVGRLQDYSPENTIGGISDIIYRYIAPSAILTLNVGEIFGLEFVSSATNTSIAGASNMNIQLVFRV